MKVILYGSGAIREYSGKELCAGIVRGEGAAAVPYPLDELSRGAYAHDARPALLLDGNAILTLAPFGRAEDVPRGPVDSVWVFELAAAERGLYRVDVGGAPFWALATGRKEVR